MEGADTGGAGRPSWLAPGLLPFDSHYAEVEGHRIHYLDEGDGPPLLLLHGNPTWSFLYRRVIARLRPTFRCVAPDYPGFGLSAAAPGYDYLPASHASVVETFVEQLGLSGVTMMVQDWGGPIGLAVAERRPEWFRGLVVSNTWAWPIQGSRRLEWFATLVGSRLGAIAIRRFNAFVNLVLPLGVRRVRLSPEVMAAYRGPFRTMDARRPTHVFPRELAASAPFLAQVDAGLSALSHLPVLLAWGDSDPAFGAHERSRFEASFPRASTVILHGAGHYIQEDAPDELCDAILGWFGRVMATQ